MNALENDQKQSETVGYMVFEKKEKCLGYDLLHQFCFAWDQDIRKKTTGLLIDSQRNGA